MKYLTIENKCRYFSCVLNVIFVRLPVYWSYFFRSDVCLATSSFRSNVVSAKCPLDLVCVGHLSFCHLSFRLNVFRPNVLRLNVFSVICLSAICPLGHLSFGHLSYHRAWVWLLMCTYRARRVGTWVWLHKDFKPIGCVHSRFGEWGLSVAAEGLGL